MVSVIIPTYNRQRTIKRAVESVLEQTFRDIEVIVIDDHSTDNTKEIINNIDDCRLRYFYNQTNMGACAARNRGIQLSRGEYIAFQDSDDFWHEDKLEKQLSRIKRLGADVCFCKHEKFVNNISQEVIPMIEYEIWPYETLVAHSIVSTQTILARKDVFEEIRFDDKLKRLQDYDWTVRAGLKYKFCSVNEVLVDVYLQDDSITNTTKYEETLVALLNKYNTNFDTFKIVIPYILNKIANVREFNSEMASDLYLKAYKISKNKVYIIKAIVSKLGMMKLLFRVNKIKY